MSNIVSFKKAEPLVWVCSSCGCSTFRLYSDSSTECASCGHIGSDHGKWFEELPEPVANPPTRLPETKVISYGSSSPAAALRSMMNRVNADNLVALIALEENGRVRTWGGVDTVDRAKWIEGSLREAFRLLTTLVPK